MTATEPAPVVLDEATHLYYEEPGHIIVPGVTQTLGDNDLLPRYKVSDFAMQRGRVVHRCCELLVKGQLNWKSVDPGALGYLRAFENFLRVSGFVVLGSEEIVYHKLLRYAGKLDLHGFLNRRPTILDIKTGKAIRIHGVQLASYEAARCYPLPPLAHRAVLELHEDGTFALVPFEDPADFQLFPALLAVANWKKNAGLLKWWEEGYWYGDI